MKKFCLSIALLLISNIAISQVEWAPTGARWHYDYSYDDIFNGEQHYVIEVNVTKDTILQGKNCRELSSVGTAPWAGGGPVSFGLGCYSSQLKQYTYSEAGKVYFYRAETSEFVMFYDFNAQPGDSWGIPLCESDFIEFDTMTILVNSVSSASFNGQELKVLNVSRVTPTGITFSNMVVYEGIGGVPEMMIYNEDWPIESGIEDIFCYRSDDTGLISFSSDNCDALTGTKEQAGIANASSVYPNPTTDYLNFQLRSPQPVKNATFRIVSASGQVMKSFEARDTDATFIVPVWDWATGAYFLQYLEKGEVRTTERFLVFRSNR